MRASFITLKVAEPNGVSEPTLREKAFDKLRCIAFLECPGDLLGDILRMPSGLLYSLGLSPAHGITFPGNGLCGDSTELPENSLGRSFQSFFQPAYRCSTDDGVGDNVIIDFRRRDGSSGGGSGGGGIGRGEETGVELADFGAPHRKKESAVTSSSRSRPAYQTVDTRGSSEEKKMSVSNPMQAGRSTTPTNDPPGGAAAAEEEDDSRWL